MLRHHIVITLRHHIVSSYHWNTIL